MNIRLLTVASLFLFGSCHNNNEDNSSVANKVLVPATMNYTVTNVYPHDSTSFTEGFEWFDNSLYESTGEYGTSILAKVDLKTGKHIQKINLSKDFFGEGITILNGKIYQLTYKESKCFVYDVKTLNKLQEFTYTGEGWGMTNDGKYLIMDDSTDKLTYRDPNTFDIVKQISVSDNYGPLAEINELEYVDGFIYSNVWQRDIIVKIDPKTGAVVAKADLTNIWKETGLTENDRADVTAQKRFFITGKKWNKMFEVRFN